MSKIQRECRCMRDLTDIIITAYVERGNEIKKNHRVEDTINVKCGHCGNITAIELTPEQLESQSQLAPKTTDDSIVVIPASSIMPV